jgi:hypothetical protein
VRVNAPCKDCADRNAGCHSTCLAYKDYLENHTKDLQMLYDDKKNSIAHLGYLKEQKTKRMRHAR